MELMLYGLGSLSIGVLGLIGYQSIQQKAALQQERQKIRNCNQISTLQSQDKAFFDKKSRLEQKLTYLQVDRLLASDLSQKTFTKVLHSIPNSSRQDTITNQRFLIGECGDSFRYKLQSFTTLKVDIKQCNIHELLLDTKFEHIRFKNNIYPYFGNMKIYLKAATGLSMVGMIKYNLESKEFEFSPKFMLPLVPKKKFFMVVDHFYSYHILQQTLNQIMIGASIVVLLFIGCFINRDRIRRFWTGKNGIPPKVKARGKDALRCRCGQPMNVVGDCGHLSICRDCFQRQKGCRLCGSYIYDPTFIFI